MFKKLTIPFFVMLFVVAPAWADWDPGDGHKMHYPQLPDVNGWDVAATATGAAPGIIRHVADDWRCSETGPVLDIHFWGSWKNGTKGTIDAFMIEIWADDPAGPGGYFEDNEYSTPLYRFTDEHYPEPDDPRNGEPGIYWYYGAYLGGGEVTERLYGYGDQGWYDPHDGTAIQNDHTEIYQYNINMQGLNVFHQGKDTIYWLMITAYLDEAQSPAGAEWGWKTSASEHFMDDAVYFDSLTTVPFGYEYPHEGWDDLPAYMELRDPLDQMISLDMAFVITPEPATLGLLLIGGFLALSRKFR